MKRRECSSSSTSAAIEDMKEFIDYQLELFKVETDEMLPRMIKQLKELAAEDSAKRREKKKAEHMPKTAGQAQSQKSTQSEPQHRDDSSSRNCILPLKDVRAGSEMDAVSNDLEAEQERNGRISSNNEGENEKEVEDAAELEDLSTVNGRRKSRRTIKEPAWMKDFMTV